MFRPRQPDERAWTASPPAHETWGYWAPRVLRIGQTSHDWNSMSPPPTSRAIPTHRATGGSGSVQDLGRPPTTEWARGRASRERPPYRTHRTKSRRDQQLLSTRGTQPGLPPRPTARTPGTSGAAPPRSSRAQPAQHQVQRRRQAAATAPTESSHRCSSCGPEPETPRGRAGGQGPPDGRSQDEGPRAQRRTAGAQARRTRIPRASGAG